jgi:hypothetical protein
MALVSANRNQDLRVLEGRFSVEHLADERRPVPGVEWLALVHGPDGWTVMRRQDDAADGGWAVLWSGDEPHDPQATGMLSAIVAPLADREIPVMAASTFHADLVLIPCGRLDEALSALRAAGHNVVR